MGQSMLIASSRRLNLISIRQKQVPIISSKFISFTDHTNRAGLRAATKLVSENTALDIFELDGISGFNQAERQDPPANIVELKKRIGEADAVLIVKPECSYFVPGVLRTRLTGRPGLTRQSMVWKTGGDHGRFDWDDRHSRHNTLRRYVSFI
jgi:NADPH-dependent FMN reductase